MLIGSIITGFAEFACSAWVSNVTGTMVTKCGNKFIDKFIIGAGGTIVGSLIVDKAVDNLKSKLTVPKVEINMDLEVKEENADGRSEE